MNIVTIQGPTSVKSTLAGNKISQKFVVRNSSGAAMRIGTRFVSDDETVNQWIKLQKLAKDGAEEIDLEENTVTEIKVNLAIPSDAAAGRVSYRLEVFNANQTSQSTQSEAAFLDIKEKKNGAICWPCIIGAAVGVLAVVGVLVWFLTKSDKLEDMTQMALADAETYAEQHGIVLNKKIVRVSAVQARKLLKNGLAIIKQDPAKGSKITKDMQVAVDVAGVRVPAIINKSAQTAMESIINTTGLVLEKVNKKKVASAGLHGKVLRSTPSQNTDVPLGTFVTITVGQRQGLIISDAVLKHLQQSYANKNKDLILKKQLTNPFNDKLLVRPNLP